LSEWSHLLTKTVTYALRNGVNASGSPTYASQLTCSAMIEEMVSRVQVGESIEWKTYHKVATEVDLPHGTRVWLPAASVGDNNASLLVRGRKSATSHLSGDVLYELTL